MQPTSPGFAAREAFDLAETRLNLALSNCKWRAAWQGLIPICDEYRTALASLVQSQGYPNRQLRDEVFSQRRNMFPAMSMGGFHNEAIAILKQDVNTWCNLHAQMPAEDIGFLSLLEEVRATALRAGEQLMTEGEQWHRAARDYLAIHLDIADRLPETFSVEEAALNWMAEASYPECAPAFRQLIALREANVRRHGSDPYMLIALEDTLSKFATKLSDAGYFAPALEVYERAHAMCTSGFARWPQRIEWWTELMLSHIFVAQTHIALEQGELALPHCKCVLNLLESPPPTTASPEQIRRADTVALTAVMEMRNRGADMLIKRDLIHTWMLVGDRAGAREVVEADLISWEAELNFRR